jgi:hypothetical protein
VAVQSARIFAQLFFTKILAFSFQSLLLGLKFLLDLSFKQTLPLFLKALSLFLHSLMLQRKTPLLSLG